MSIPIIRLEIAGMQHTVQVALTQYAAQMDADIQKAIAEALTPERIYHVIRDTAQKEIERTVIEEIESFFRYNGEGHRFIRDAVAERLAKQLKETTKP